MLHPSYKEMLDKMNETRIEGEAEVVSRYSLVLAASKRARQLNAGSEPLVDTYEKEKNLSAAVDEMFAGMVHILEETEEETPEIETNDTVMSDILFDDLSDDTAESDEVSDSEIEA